jgi:cell division protein FtsQ
VQAEGLQQISDRLTRLAAEDEALREAVIAPRTVTEAPAPAQAHRPPRGVEAAVPREALPEMPGHHPSAPSAATAEMPSEASRPIFRAAPPRLLNPPQAAFATQEQRPAAPASFAAPSRPGSAALPVADAASGLIRPRRPAAMGGEGRHGATERPPRTPKVVRDPAPSRLSYRMNRLWLTPLFRSFMRVGVPGFATALVIGVYLGDEDRRAAIAGLGSDLVRQVQERPEFMVNLMAVEGASPAVDLQVRTAVPVDLPVSSWDLDLEAMREAVVAIDAVASADLRIRPGGILEVAVVERVPAVVWRGPTGLELLDETGVRVGPADSRLDRPDLPLLAGEGAEKAVPEALALIDAAAPVMPRVRGLVRMGERRWDVVLDRGQRILLPAEGAIEALERVMALAESEDMLERDVSVIDMRFGERPTLRLTPAALDAFRGKAIDAGATNG